jgi:hypothetical protein
MSAVSDKFRVLESGEFAYALASEMSSGRINLMNTSSHSSPRKTPGKSKLEQSNDFDPGCLAYEDVVSLATRLSKRGYTELAKDFLAFANSPTGLASIYCPRSKRGKARPSRAAFPDVVAAIPYVVAATVLMKSKTLRREEVCQAVLLIELGKAKTKVIEEEEPPLFMD